MKPAIKLLAPTGRKTMSATRLLCEGNRTLREQAKIDVNDPTTDIGGLSHHSPLW